MKDEELKFQIHIVKKNVYTSKFLLSLIFLFQLFNIVYLVGFRANKINQFPANAYLFMYITLATITAVCILLAHFLQRNVMQHSSVLTYITILYVSILCLWGSGITLLDLRNHENVHVYLLIVIAIAATIYIKPLIISIILSINHLLFICFFSTFQLVETHNAGNYINSTIGILIALSISITRYYSESADYQNQQTILMQNRRLNLINKELINLTITDPLSGLYNRRFLDDALAKEYKHALTNQYPLTILMLDIDNFKNYNDFYGHDTGDYCIKMVAEVLKKCTDEVPSYAFRYGGEEFTILFSNIHLKQAWSIAERIRLEVMNLNLVKDVQFDFSYVSISSGLYHGIPQAGVDPFEYIKSADEALLTAKARGKNQVILYH